MTCSELIAHLEQVRREYGDIEVRVDADLFTDTATRDVTSMAVHEYMERPIQEMIIGLFPREGNIKRLVMYVGNEPHYNLTEN